MSEYLLLKWGGIKGWELETDTSKAALQEWAKDGVSMSAAMQDDSPEQKQAICKLIDALDGTIKNDWTGEVMTKDEAKRYVMEYSR